MNTAALENPMVIGAARAYELSLGNDTSQTAWLMAQDRVLADVEDFANNLATLGRDHASGDKVLRDPMRISNAEDDDVLHALLIAKTDSDLRACRDELVRRHLDNNSERIARLASEYAL